jgi:ABC-type dipeptide/oligopeptide/nickel transport system ATPase component
MNENNENYIFDKFVKRIRARLLFQNKNWLGIICGETGSGKSYSALSLAYLISNRVHVVFTPLEFLSLLNNSNIQKGDVVIFDEAGVGMSSREWYSVQNKLLGTVLQTFRNMNVAVIFTTPNLSFIDVQARKLFHSYMETSYIDYENEESFLKVFDIQINGRFNKIYYKRPRIINDVTGSVYTMSHLVLDKPSEEACEHYEGLKSEYTKKLNANALNELLEPTGKTTKKPEIDIDKVISKVKQEKKKYLKQYNQRIFIDTDLLRSDFDLSISQAKNVKKQVENEVL